MIGRVLALLKQQLNSHLQASTGWTPAESTEDRVVFIDGEKMDPLSFKLEAVSLLLINVEEENTLRSPDPYSKVLPDGSRRAVQPAVRLNLYVLFVARFKQYEKGLNYLSLIIQFFQNHRVFNHGNAPGLDQGIEQLSIELVTLPFGEQNEIWNALRTTYHPSVLYKVRMLTFADEDVVPSKDVTEKRLDIRESVS